MKSPHHLEQQGPSSMNRYGKGLVTAVLGSGTGARGMKSPEEELRDRPPTLCRHPCTSESASGRRRSLCWGAAGLASPGHSPPQRL